MKFQRSYPSNLLVLFSFLLLGMLQISSTWAEENHEVPMGILQKAMHYVHEHDYGGSDGDKAKVFELLKSRNVDTLYEVAKSMNTMKDQNEKLASIEIWDALAEGGHTLSQVALGFAYAEADKRKAITYFVAAAEGSPPHQVAMYNAGRLLADPEVGNYVKSLAYLQGAWNMGNTRPQYSTTHMVETSKLAYELLSEQLVDIIEEKISEEGAMISIEHIANMFGYASLDQWPPNYGREVKEYSKAMRSMHFNEWEIAVTAFGNFEEKYRDKMSNLQKTILNVLIVYCETASLTADEL